MTEEKIQVHAVISGRVQGVFYRAETRNTALKHNVTGWVRNLSSGDVEAVFEGSRADVNRVIDWCRKGPPAASVDEVKAEETGELSNFTSFDVTF